LIRGVFVELHLDDLIEAASDGGKPFVHLFTETADLIAHVGTDVLAFLFDRACEFVELGLFVPWHAGQYTIPTDEAMGSTGVERASVGFARPSGIFQASDLQSGGGAAARS
jgi:hypothetical protein